MTDKKPTAKKAPAKAAAKAPTKAQAAKKVSSSAKTAPRKSTANDPVFDDTSRAHLEELKEAIDRVLNANLQRNEP